MDIKLLIVLLSSTISLYSLPLKNHIKITESYLLEPSTLLKPIYNNYNYINNNNNNNRINKRQITVNNNITTKTFLIDFYCLPSKYIYKTPLTTKQTNSICNKIRNKLEQGALKISNSINIKHTIKVNITFESFCKNKRDQSDYMLENPCKEFDSTLASASPTSFHSIISNNNDTNLDSDFLYPSALLKQYLPHESVFNPTYSNQFNYYDIQMKLNSDFLWWIEHDGIFNDELIRNNTIKNIPKSIYDIEQIFIHE